MKTQILQLDEHDDVISTRDKMNWGQTGRILLVWPQRARVLRRRVDLVVLQRHSAALGAQLALVTGDPVVRFNARFLSIPVFKSLRQAQSAHWRVERRRRIQHKPKLQLQPARDSDELQALRLAAKQTHTGWSSQPAARVGIFTLGVLAVLSLAAVLLPGAEVHLQPRTTSQELTLTVRASATQENINLAGIIPARAVTVIVEGRESRQSSGTSQVPDQAATGSIVFTNLSDKSVEIPEGLVVRTLEEPLIRFATLQGGIIDAGPGITETLEASALTPGTSGNLAPNTLIAIEGSLGLSLSATNPERMRGGANRQLPAPTKSDREILYQHLESALQDTALRELQSQLAPGDLMFTPTLTLTQVLDIAYLPADEQPSGEVLLNLRLEYSALRTNRRTLETLANVLLDANLPDGYLAQVETLVIEQVTPPKMENPNVAVWQVKAQRSLQASIPIAQAINLVLGSPTQEARQLLEGKYPLTSQPVIRVTPAWWPRLPILPFRITVVL